ncbi:type II toxin-antitoxin system VapB family antitoxin [Kribbella sp. NPDC051587]|uniref:type II toxin-antitoxin system VapB family antitoxin n=1 Tax=Kribbella sp. NPDC051587 TaxID=3364119 RepID=UPI0037B1324B
MTRISVDVNDEWLDAARAELGTDSKVETINAALHEFARRQRARALIATLDDVELDTSGSADAWRYGGGRDLSKLEEDAREAPSA